MKLRIPSTPLIAVDPYFSVWSPERLYSYKQTEHWTGAKNTMIGMLYVDGEGFNFLGHNGAPRFEPMGSKVDTFSSTYFFKNEKIELTVRFMTPTLVTDLYLASRPVSYMKLSYRSLDGLEHKVSATISLSEEFVLDKAGDGRMDAKEVKIDGLTTMRMGNAVQNPLNRSGDNLRIDWGYLYLSAVGGMNPSFGLKNNLYFINVSAELEPTALFLFAYDDVYSIKYFGSKLKAYWCHDGKTIEQAIKEASEDYEVCESRCAEFAEKLIADATAKGGEKYAELLAAAYRQVMAAHKLVVDDEGNNLYISKECFSNGCAATVDVTYPSAPMFLLYNTELLKGMLRPIFKFARSNDWEYDFAPHDVGQYPILEGQVYSPHKLEMQMPVEESGNIIILMNAICNADGDISFAKENLDLLTVWKDYLIKYGEDPENQLCTDDFAGHLSHNCNLSIKAIMGISAYADIVRGLGDGDEADRLEKIAGKYADSFLAKAENSDGSYRLAYDRPETFSLKYNAVWDKIWKKNIFPDKFYEGEIARYKKEALYYGIPLDSRDTYTKSDWTVWAACLSNNREDFEYIISLLWKAFNTTHTRVPMTDWYYADTSEYRGFRHRTVQGGLFIKLMLD